MTGSICGTGSYIPHYTMDNYAIADLVETSQGGDNRLHGSRGREAGS